MRPPTLCKAARTARRRSPKSARKPATPSPRSSSSIEMKRQRRLRDRIAATKSRASNRRPSFSRCGHAATRDHPQAVAGRRELRAAARRAVAASAEAPRNRSALGADWRDRTARTVRAHEQSHEVSRLGVKRKGRSSFCLGIIRPEQRLGAKRLTARLTAGETRTPRLRPLHCFKP